MIKISERKLSKISHKKYKNKNLIYCRINIRKVFSKSRLKGIEFSFEKTFLHFANY